MIELVFVKRDAFNSARPGTRQPHKLLMEIANLFSGLLCRILDRVKRCRCAGAYTAHCAANHTHSISERVRLVGCIMDGVKALRGIGSGALHQPKTVSHLLLPVRRSHFRIEVCYLPLERIKGFPHGKLCIELALHPGCGNEAIQFFFDLFGVVLDFCRSLFPGFANACKKRADMQIVYVPQRSL